MGSWRIEDLTAKIEGVCFLKAPLLFPSLLWRGKNIIKSQKYSIGSFLMTLLRIEWSGISTWERKSGEKLFVGYTFLYVAFLPILFQLSSPFSNIFPFPYHSSHLSPDFLLEQEIQISIINVWWSDEEKFNVKKARRCW